MVVGGCAAFETSAGGPFDDFGRTLWYTIAGTGGDITVDTAGSIVDRVIGAYVKDGEDFVEVPPQMGQIRIAVR